MKTPLYRFLYTLCGITLYSLGVVICMKGNWGKEQKGVKRMEGEF